MRYTSKPGDIFEVTLSDKKKYFQFIEKDVEYMGAHMIRTFDYEIGLNDKPELSAILKSKVTNFFYTKTIEGQKDNYWKKIGNHVIESSFEAPTWRQTPDVFSTTPVSENWYLWKGNINNRKNIGRLTDEYRKFPHSIILPPMAIVEWLETGDTGFKQPG